MRLETIAVHAGGSPDPATGAVAPPIHLSTTFEHGPESEKLHGFMYIRDGNPAEARLEPALAAVEGGEAALVFASGMAAAAAALQTLPSGSHVLFADDIYYAVRDIAKDFLPRWGIESSVVNMADLPAVERSIRKNTRLLWAESPSNPLLNVVDLAALAKLARAAGAELLVDGTFATPVLQRPLALGAGVVLHSATKYLGGHSDVQGGALVFARRGDAYEKSMHVRHILGGVLSPFNTWLVLRGLRTLPCRVERQSQNALAVARALEGHPVVETVHYPGLATHPGHEVAKRQMTGFGGMLSLRIRGGRERAIAVAARVKVFTNATSLGGVESTLEHRASSEGPGSTTPPNLLRVSVGLEHAQDLIDDLLQALG
ncbi:MAG TPA: aminotransferase class I/II-fold pyridoxal phosphate-dependent enzyme [Thermoanaerobaculia bacterium]